MPTTAITAERQANAAPTRRLLFIGTGGVLADIGRATQLRDDKLLPPTELSGRNTILLDLGGMTLTPGPMRELIVTLGQRVKGGVYGNANLILATADPALSEMIDLLAGAYGLPLYLAKSSSESDVRQATPAGTLTATERETLATLTDIGGRTTVAALAEHVGSEPTAVNNRLASLHRKGYLYRYPRPRRMGDVYVDPRISPLEPAARATGTNASHAIHTDPYGREPLRLEGDAAKRAAKLVEQRTAHHRRDR